MYTREHDYVTEEGLIHAVCASNRACAVGEECEPQERLGKSGGSWCPNSLGGILAFSVWGQGCYIPIVSGLYLAKKLVLSKMLCCLNVLYL